MLLGAYQFFCRLENDAELPVFKGSTFRGVFGRALKKVVCALKRQECETCLLRGRCLYTLVFETLLAKPPPEGARVIPPPHPFVIEAPATEQTHFPAGDEFNFNLLLFGSVNQAFPYFVYAFDQMGKIGIGRKVNGERGRFILESVTSNNKTIYSGKTQRLEAIDGLQSLCLELPPPSPETFSLKVTIETPLRLKFENRLHADLPFHILARAMLRRVSSLLAVYGNGEPDIDYKGLVQRAAAVQTAQSDLKWFDWRRYSLRQEREMLMGGMTGSVVYRGLLAEYLPLIDICRRIHIGKQTTFGLGKFNTEIMS